jgi:hypothetical protein
VNIYAIRKRITMQDRPKRREINKRPNSPIEKELSKKHGEMMIIEFYMYPQLTSLSVVKVVSGPNRP